MSNKKEKQIELPFQMEGNTAPRHQIRASEGKIQNQDGLYKVDFSIIKIRPGFNPRKKPEGMDEELWEEILGIPALADGIFESCGPSDPILGDIYAEDGCFYITEGERRFRALRLLMKQGRIRYNDGKEKDKGGTYVHEVRVILNPVGTTDLQRKRIALQSNDKLKLTPMQRARYYLTFIMENGMTHDKLADFLKVSRQTVDNYIMANELPQDVQDKLDAGEINISAALAAHREANPKKAGKKLSVVDEDGVIVSEFQENKAKEAEKEKEKERGDEGEFIQEDNSKDFAGSKGGPKGESSGAHAIGTDSIYMQQKTEALWKQFVHRYEKLKIDIMDGNRKMTGWEDELASRLKNEYNLTVK